MTEPTSTTTGAVGLTAVLILLLGPKLGPVLAPIVSEYLLILDGGGNGFAGTWSNAGSGKAGVVIITEFVLTAV
jgi:hypothetical protein